MYMYFVIKKRLFINAVCPRFEFQFSIHIHVFLIEKKMNGTIRKFMMEKPDRIYRNFRTPYKCIKKFLFYTSCEMQTHRKYVL